MKSKRSLARSGLILAGLLAAPAVSPWPFSQPVVADEPAPSSATEAKLKTLIAERLSVGQDQLEADADFVEQLGADSLTLVQLTTDVEEAFNIKIPDEEIAKLTTVGALAAYVELHAKK